MIAWVLARQFEELIYVLRHGEEGGAEVEAVAARKDELAELTAGAVVGLVHIHRMTGHGQAHGGGQPGNSGSDDGGFHTGTTPGGRKGLRGVRVVHSTACVPQEESPGSTGHHAG